MYVVKGQQESLLGWVDSEKLGISPSGMRGRQVLNQFPELFQGIGQYTSISRRECLLSHRS